MEPLRVGVVVRECNGLCDAASLMSISPSHLARLGGHKSGDGRHHAVIVVDDQERLAGLVSQSDLLAMLLRPLKREAA